jgi:hypothetical protein
VIKSPKRKHDNRTVFAVKRAIMAKYLRCLPSQIDEEDYEDLEMIELVTDIIGKDNPLWLI